MITLNNLKSTKGTHRNIKRIGRGVASGQGTQAGKGHKGQKARAGGGVRTGFEGGNMPLYMRLPKRGFSNYLFKTHYNEINVAELARFQGEEVTKEALIEQGFISGKKKSFPVKILGTGEISKGLKFAAGFKFTKSAEEKITKAGGSIGQ